MMLTKVGQCEGFVNGKRCTTYCYSQTWDRKTICRSCARHLNFKIYDAYTHQVVWQPNGERQ